MRRCPPLSAFCEEVVLPAAVRGPVDRSHGLQVRISVAWRARRSEVQGVPMGMLQKFVRLSVPVSGFIYQKFKEKIGAKVSQVNAPSSASLQ